MSAIKDGGPAFPQKMEHPWSFVGISLRDYFAIRAPEPTLERMQMEQRCDRNRNPHNEPHKPPIRSDVEIRCDLAYEYADAMIKAREK